jgi:prepilin-type N-terminal cleavage/methylation domain-containing protein
MKLRKRAFTLIEILVVIAISGVVFGLILDALIETDRGSRAIVSHQQMRQEAMAISNSLEKLLRMHPELSPQGGAAPEPASGGALAAEIPASLNSTGMTTAVLKQAARQSAAERDVNTTVSVPSRVTSGTLPSSVRDLFSTSTQPSSKESSGTRHTEFTTSSITLGSLAFVSPGQVSTGIWQIVTDKSAGASCVAAHELNSSKFRKLGVLSDQFQSEIYFRFGEPVEGKPEVQYEEEAQSKLPSLIEYTIRVWPRSDKYPSFDSAISPEGRPLRFAITSAVAMR